MNDLPPPPQPTTLESPTRPRMGPSAGQAAWRLEEIDRGRLAFIAADGGRHDDIEVVRAFPFSDPEGPAAVLAADGRELAWLDDPSVLPEPTRAAVEAQLAERAFRPVITRIHSIVGAQPGRWQVDTDRGRRDFTVDHPEDIRRGGSHAVVITDSVGLRFLIPDRRRLDPRSRRLLDRNG